MAAVIEQTPSIVSRNQAHAVADQSAWVEVPAEARWATRGVKKTSRNPLARCWGWLSARLFEAPQFVAIQPWHRPDAEYLYSPVAVATLESALPARYRLLVGLMRWAGLSWSEVAGLRRGACRPSRGELRIEADADDGCTIEPRSLRHRPTCRLEPALAEDLADHLATVTGPGRRSLVFSWEDGSPLDYRLFLEEVWRPALERAGFLDQLEPIDLQVCWMLELAEEAP